MNVQILTDPLHFVQADFKPTFLFLKRCARSGSVGGKKNVHIGGVGHHVWRMYPTKIF